MIDTIGVYVDIPEINGATSDFFHKEYVDVSTGTVNMLGKIKNLRLKISGSVLIISGSLPKYLWGHNLFTLSYSDFCRVIDSISTSLQIDIKSAKVFRIDLAHNIALDSAVPNYLINFISSGRLSKMVYNDYQSILFFNKNCCIEFYDKLVEMKRKKSKVPDMKLTSGNILRYELKLLKQPMKFLKMKTLTISDLLEKDVFDDLLTLWKNKYAGITKASNHIFQDKSISPKTFEKTFAKIGITNYGVSKTKSLINTKTSTSNRYIKTRLNKKLTSIMQAKNPQETNELIRELDTKIFNFEILK